MDNFHIEYDKPRYVPILGLYRIRRPSETIKQAIYNSSRQIFKTMIGTRNNISDKLPIFRNNYKYSH